MYLLKLLFVADKVCNLWVKKTWPVPGAKVSVTNQTSQAISFVKTKSSQSRLKVSSSKPWGDLQEPVDIERNFDTVSVEDIDNYGKFMQTKVSSLNSPFRTVSLCSESCFESIYFPS